MRCLLGVTMTFQFADRGKAESRSVRPAQKPARPRYGDTASEGRFEPGLQDSRGQPLDAETSNRMEPLFGRDFSGVRVHTAASTPLAAADAPAYAIGRDIYFAAGRYTPRTPEGGRLLAHELAHVTQQTQPGSASMSSPTSVAEHEARAAADAVAAGTPFAVQWGTGVSRALAMTSPTVAVSHPTDMNEQEAERVADKLSSGCQGCHESRPCPTCADVGPIHRAAVSTDTESGAGVAAPIGGRALDAGTKAWFEPRLGASLSGVRIHTDESTAEAARHLHARAFTIGGHIGFGAGEYAPGTAGGHRLLAHELAHVVQQSSGQGWARPMLQRKPVEGTEDPTVVGERAAAAALAPRSRGTASELQRGTEMDVAAIREAGGIEEFHTRLVDPKFDVLERQIGLRAEERENIKRGELEGWWNKLWTYGSTRELYQDAVEWIQNHMNEIEKSRKDESQIVDQFNTWVPQGQQFYDSIVRMALKLRRLGLATGTEPEAVMQAFAEGLWAELARSDALVNRAARSHGAPEYIPRTDTSVSALLGTMRADATALHAAWLGIQQTAIEERIKSIKREAKPDLERMAEIEEAKKFVREVGHIADLGLAATGKIDKAVGKVSGKAEKYRMYRLRKRVVKGDVDPDVLPVEEEVKEDEGSGLPELSVEGVLGFVTDLAYSGEVRELKRRIGMVESRATAAGSVQAELQVQKREAEFIAALERLAATAAQLRVVLVQRREDYARLGVELDRLAREDSKAREKKFAPAPGREYFALGLSIVADVREALAMGRSAASFSTSELGFRAKFNERWSEFIHVRTRKPTHWSERLIVRLEFPAEEEAFLRDIEQQLVAFYQKLGKFEGLFENVEAKATELLKTLHPGAEQGEPQPGKPGEVPDISASSY
ncbi:eCIS core domain-containing protein [Streptomyces sp. NPDC055722]